MSTSTTTALAVLLLAAGAALAAAPVTTVPRRHDRPGAARPVLVRARIPLSVLSAVAAWVVVGGVAGLVGGAVAGVVSVRVLGRAEGAAAARRRRGLTADLPAAVGLLADVLDAGAPVARALDDVAAALPGPVADELRAVHRRLELGADPVVVWRSVEGPLRPLGRHLARAHASGSSVVPAVERAAADLAAEARRAREERARSVEVRAAAPLGLCFLPAFLLLGVVPLVAGLVGAVGTFG